VLLAPGQQELLIRFSDNGRTLDLDGRSPREDQRFARAARAMDHLEHRPGTPSGNLISLVKRIAAPPTSGEKPAQASPQDSAGPQEASS
jgi:hypothetical protein